MKRIGILALIAAFVMIVCIVWLPEFALALTFGSGVMLGVSVMMRRMVEFERDNARLREYNAGLIEENDNWRRENAELRDKLDALNWSIRRKRMS